MDIDEKIAEFKANIESCERVCEAVPTGTIRDAALRKANDCKQMVEWLEDYKRLSSSEKANKWIPISERLPEKGVEVLATTEWGAVTIAERYSENDWFIYEGDTTANADEIKAWCELPPSYKAESED